MSTFYDGSVKGHITKDGTNVTHIRHSQELRASDENDPVEAASAYLRDAAETLGPERPRLGNLTAGDPSNVVRFTGAESIEEWRLVPGDNNIGQRNVTVVPGGAGLEALILSMADALFVAGDNLPRPARMELRVTMPGVLAGKGWALDLDDAANGFRLNPGAKRRLKLRLVPGAPRAGSGGDGAAHGLLERLGADGADVTKVTVKKVSLDIEFGHPGSG